MPETLISKFITDKLSSYEEPERKGTPRGYEIGFSKKKYHASLMMLTDLSENEIAKIVGISAGTLRNWLMTEQFMDKIRKNCDEFVDDIPITLNGDFTEIATDYGEYLIVKLIERRKYYFVSRLFSFSFSTDKDFELTLSNMLLNYKIMARKDKEIVRRLILNMKNDLTKLF